ncbi:hypothetical protein A6769_33180 [Nostoc punctiforme NIES-2108]|uniref:Uncharacterized protein n=1 Tax=Nostoc punctiforme NIES-2108 TaxID=1356359 RepID=A0A367R4R8_NOSPU|nr:hypothetical protein A6769_33180 [Nostoc punctiforme NIES-2108]
MLENTSFAFIANKLNVNCTLPIKIIENHYFQKANYIQIQEIKNHLKKSGYFSDYFQFNLSPYEFVYVQDENTPEKQNFKSQHLEPEEWKYYILAFQGNNSEIYNLQQVANLAEIELEIALVFLYHKEVGGYGIQKNPIHSFNCFFEIDRNDSYSHESINDTHLQEVSLIYQDFKNLDEAKYLYIKQAIKMLEELKHLPYHSKFRIIGLFTIIEFLITHKQIDTGDSITRQVTNKMALLSKRFSKQLDYSAFFKDIPESTIWKKLYAYRSCIAHGTQADFQKELSVLKDDSTARKFLKLVVKTLLRHSLSEPQLYTDLKEC